MVAGPTPGRKRARAAKAFWSFGDQALSSGTNFALTILVARSVSAAEFGAFAIAVSVYLLCLTLGRSSISEAIVLSLGRPDGLRHGELASGLSATLLLALSASAITATTAAIVPNDQLTDTLLVLAVGLPGLLVQDYRRIVFFALRDPRRAFVSDLLWAILQLTGIAVAVGQGVRSPAALLGIWALSALLSAMLWPSTTRGWWRTSGLAWMRREKSTLAPLAGEGLLFQLGNQVSVFLLGSLAGLSQAGAYRGAQSLFGPVTVLIMGLRTAVLPELMRVSRTSRPQALAGATKVTVAAVLLAAGWGAALVVLPDALGAEILGSTWVIAAPLLWLVAIDRACNAVAWGSALRLRILMRPRVSFVVRVIATVSSVVVAVVGSSLGGAWGVALGTALVSPLLVVVGIVAVRWARRTSPGQDTSRMPLERSTTSNDTVLGKDLAV